MGKIHFGGVVIIYYIPIIGIQAIINGRVNVKINLHNDDGDPVLSLWYIDVAELWNFICAEVL